MVLGVKRLARNSRLRTALNRIPLRQVALVWQA